MRQESPNLHACQLPWWFRHGAVYDQTMSYLSMAIGFSPLVATKFPAGGHHFSPLVAVKSPHRGLGRGGQVRGLTPLPAVACASR